MAQRKTRSTSGGAAKRLESAVDSLEKEFERVQKQLRTRGKQLEKTLEKQRKQLETRSRKQLKSLASDVKKSAAWKRAQSLRKDAEKQFETGVENLLSALQIASRSEIDRLDRRIRTLNKKLNDLEKEATTSSPGGRS